MVTFMTILFTFIFMFAVMKPFLNFSFFLSNKCQSFIGNEWVFIYIHLFCFLFHTEERLTTICLSWDGINFTFSLHVVRLGRKSFVMCAMNNFIYNEKAEKLLNLKLSLCIWICFLGLIYTHKYRNISVKHNIYLLYKGKKGVNIIFIFFFIFKA